MFCLSRYSEDKGQALAVKIVEAIEKAHAEGYEKGYGKGVVAGSKHKGLAEEGMTDEENDILRNMKEEAVKRWTA